MQAAFIIACTLTLKAFYMIVINIRARHRKKTHLLTFGDVVVASVLDPALQV